MSTVGIVLSTLLLSGSSAAGSDRPVGRVAPVAGGQVQAVKLAPDTAGRTAGSFTAFQTFPSQNRRSSRNWGPALTDIARHLPAGEEYDQAYRRFTQEYDLVTAGHEWTHYLNGYLCKYETCAYYVMDNRYFTLPVPKKMRGILPEIPACLRGKHYQLYFVKTGMTSSRYDPYYLLNEWTAYANDVIVAVDQLASRKPLNPFFPDATQPDTAGNVMEFTFYGCALGMAVKKHDPQYYASDGGKKLREFISFNARRSIEIYSKALKRVELNQDDSRNPRLLSDFRRSADTAEMRAWIKSDLDKDVANALLGIEATVDSGAGRKTLN